ncbi:uncharacterized protein LOC114373088 [Glycine soja]|uniref:uncharacterized protein LOC114373088 n=1 Tax=Glycine soja TaxID=3848 RepID=UPI00103A5674|nr:uncharacterized protein LOC114373088 [Glycine soja]
MVPATEADGASVEADDTRANTPTDTGAHAVEDEPEGFSGGSRDPSVLTKYADHVAGNVWTREEHPKLKLSSHGRKVHSLGRPVPAIEGLVAGTGLSSLIACSIDTGDRGLLSSFPVHVDDAVQMLLELLMAGHWTTLARAFLLHLLDCTLFANKSATNVHVVFLEALHDLSQTGRYAWGVAALCWIYEHFPSVAESTADPEYDEDSLRACRWIATKKTVKSIRTLTYRERLDRLRISDVYWIPYGEHRPVWEFHMISCYSGLLR